MSVLPIKYQSESFKHTKNFNIIDGTINLATLEQRLGKQLQIIFNPLVNILAAEIKNNKQNEKLIKNQKLHDSLSKSLNAISGSPTKDNKKQSKTFPNKKFTCWACKNDHKLMFCDEFLNKDVSDRKQFVIDQNLVATACQKTIMSKTVSHSLHVVTNHVVKNIARYSMRIKNQCQIQILQQTLTM